MTGDRTPGGREAVGDGRETVGDGRSRTPDGSESVGDDRDRAPGQRYAPGVSARLRALRWRATEPSPAVRGREPLAALAVGGAHALVVLGGLRWLSHPIPTRSGSVATLVAGLAAVGVAAAWLAWRHRALAPALLVAAGLASAVVADVASPPAIATFEGHTIVVGTSAIAAYAVAWPVSLGAVGLLGVGERVLLGEPLPERWRPPLAERRSLAVGAVVGAIHATSLLAVATVPLREVALPWLGHVVAGGLLLGFVGGYLFVREEQLAVPVALLAAMVAVGAYGAWPTGSDAAYAYLTLWPATLLVAVGGRTIARLCWRAIARRC